MIDISSETKNVSGSFLCRGDDNELKEMTPICARFDIAPINTVWDLPTSPRAALYHASLMVQVNEAEGIWAQLVNGRLNVVLPDILDFSKAESLTYPAWRGVVIHRVRRLLVYLTGGSVDSFLYTTTEFVAAKSFEMGCEMMLRQDAPRGARQFLRGFDDDGFRIRQLRGQFGARSYDN